MSRFHFDACVHSLMIRAQASCLVERSNRRRLLQNHLSRSHIVITAAVDCPSQEWNGRRNFSGSTRSGRIGLLR